MNNELHNVAIEKIRNLVISLSPDERCKFWRALLDGFCPECGCNHDKGRAGMMNELMSALFQCKPKPPYLKLGMNTIEELNRRIDELTARITSLQIELCKLEHQRRVEKSPFKIGRVIKWGKGNVGLVIQIISWCGEPAWIVRRIRQDGSEGCECKVFPYHTPKLLCPALNFPKEKQNG